MRFLSHSVARPRSSPSRTLGMARRARGLPDYLPKREAEILDVIYRLERATAEEVRDQLSDPPGNSTVRRQLESLEERGLLLHEENGRSFVYRPAVSLEDARGSALQRILRNLFGNSPSQVMASLLEMQDLREDPEELKRIARMADEARREGR